MMIWICCSASLFFTMSSHWCTQWSQVGLKYMINVGSCFTSTWVKVVLSACRRYNDGTTGFFLKADVSGAWAIASKLPATQSRVSIHFFTQYILQYRQK